MISKINTGYNPNFQAKVFLVEKNYTLRNQEDPDKLIPLTKKLIELEQLTYKIPGTENDKVTITVKYDYGRFYCLTGPTIDITVGYLTDNMKEPVAIDSYGFKSFLNANLSPIVDWIEKNASSLKEYTKFKKKD